ncbi:hypothetical protein OG897_30205 [Streptomyces sp. NBC_00237]|uniref:hypothetical protein n=1 Tax=Streptomyces sp. NBC_00237 TaxID=2975687 RepID=UPI00225B46ED|nr:hypothetical protein [Streptomyces sp. NBC_00237]MCX5205713.1 hypothetical protein [Streptomyces sp. NBC_00237]
MTTHATRITTADHHVTVTSTSKPVTDWSARYFGPWWNAADVTDSDEPEVGPVVAADVDDHQLAALTDQVTSRPSVAETVYANAPLRYVRDGDVVVACQPSELLAYRYEPGRLRIVGGQGTPVALAAARLAREILRGQLLADGWSILHASAVTNPAGDTVLTLGGKGAGKTTTALLLARSGWGLLANDRVFVRPDGDGGVRVLPWPSAAAVGLGFLDAAGLYDGVRERILAGEQLHPTQHQRVTDALMRGRRAPLRNEAGKELKPQFFPDQLASWLGLTLATEGRAARVLFPTVNKAASPAIVDDTRALGEGDLFTDATEDRYPDVFGLAPAPGRAASNASTTLALLAALPHHSISLGHDVKTNADFLAHLTDQ